MNLAKFKGIRKWIQLFFFVLIALIAINKVLALENGSIPFISQASLHALCPFGGVVTLYELITAGTFIQKIHMSSAILMVLIFATAVLFGPVFCGWVCPLGTIQEWIGKIGKKVFRNRYNHMIPDRIDHYLRFLRYGLLILVIFVTARSGQLLFEHADPYNALFAFWSEEVALPSLIILAVTLAASLLVERPWCKYACPYGALLGIFNKFRIFKVIRNQESCISCGKCSRSCPMNIDVMNLEAVKNSQCISCMECTSERSCPVSETVSFKRKNRSTRSVSNSAIAFLTLAIIFGGIAAAKATDVWTTSRDRNQSAQEIQETDGTYNLDSIKGSYTLDEVASEFDLDPAMLLKAFDVTEKDGGGQMKVKDLKNIFADTENEIGRESIQAFVALYKGLPFELQTVYLPESAVETLVNEGAGLTEEQVEYLKTHTIE